MKYIKKLLAIAFMTITMVLLLNVYSSAQTQCFSRTYRIPKDVVTVEYGTIDDRICVVFITESFLDWGGCLLFMEYDYYKYEVKRKSNSNGLFSNLTPVTH